MIKITVQQAYEIQAKLQPESDITIGAIIDIIEAANEIEQAYIEAGMK